jgi:hypothetical protein
VKQVLRVYFGFWDGVADIGEALNWNYLFSFAIIMGGDERGWSVRHRNSNYCSDMLLSYFLSSSMLSYYAVEWELLGLVERCLEDEELFTKTYIYWKFDYACRHGSNAMVDAFLNSDLFVRKIKQYEASQVLIAAAEGGRIDIVDKLLGCDLISGKITFDDICKALNRAAEHSELALVNHLLAGNYINAANGHVEKALDYVAKQGNPKAIKTLLISHVEQIKNAYEENIERVNALKELGNCLDHSELINSFVDDISELVGQFKFYISHLCYCNDAIAPILLPYRNWCQSIEQVYSKGWTTEFVGKIFSEDDILQLSQELPPINGKKINPYVRYILELSLLIHLASVAADIIFTVNLIGRFTGHGTVAMKFMSNASPLAITGCTLVLAAVTLLSGLTLADAYYFEERDRLHPNR